MPSSAVEGVEPDRGYSSFPLLRPAELPSCTHSSVSRAPDTGLTQRPRIEQKVVVHFREHLPRGGDKSSTSDTKCSSLSRRLTEVAVTAITPNAQKMFNSILRNEFGADVSCFAPPHSASPPSIVVTTAMHALVEAAQMDEGARPQPAAPPPSRASAGDVERDLNDVGDRVNGLHVHLTGSRAVDDEDGQRGVNVLAEEPGHTDRPVIEGGVQPVHLLDAVELEDTGQVRVRPTRGGGRRGQQHDESGRSRVRQAGPERRAAGVDERDVAGVGRQVVVRVLARRLQLHVDVEGAAGTGRAVRARCQHGGPYGRLVVVAVVVLLARHRRTAGGGGWAYAPPPNR